MRSRRHSHSILETTIFVIKNTSESGGNYIPVGDRVSGKSGLGIQEHKDTGYSSAGTWHSLAWTSGTDFIIRKTRDYYSGTKQILSTPFLFYFGLRPGATGLDKFIERFGPKDAFKTTDDF